MHMQQETTRSGAERFTTVTRILLVEDEGAIARCTERLIRRAATCAVEFVHVTTAEHAAMLLLMPGDAGGPFDLVISDYNLDGIETGADVLAVARSLPSPPAFLFMSSDERASRLGVRCLEKPCAPSELRAAVLALIEPAKTVCEMPLDVGGVA